MGNVFSGWHLLVILLVIVLLFGTSRLPKLSKSVVEALKIFRRSFNEASDITRSQDGHHDSQGNFAESASSVPFVKSEKQSEKRASVTEAKKSK
ncbi:twin-arginine translocase TatA/TatE family subunit [Tropheryma whipplei]|uniref:twin-arginine translocase TatA/TatE family subunit n=1 Tax=Tropheryma whipplei TaxID=2039 RepID=UPI0002EE0064|nr:twin-arginine translocase TatA/TatE family subunit [Tropheryma whipplei]MCO8182419.1 twin-arginine translocase TatA/TatE family subunit [Tropheryma whipplei]MCO8190189.1 twin-arginine translocase TatA/TatE family subunit [Tropheryma whipplei]